MEKLLLATNNKGKVNELRNLLKGVPFELIGLSEAGISTVVEETGQTFEENAILKATALAAESGLLALADDSGLEVDALGGEPGVRSARYAGENATDEERVAYLLAKLKDVPWEKRTGRVKSVMAVATPSGEVKTVSWEIPVMIALEPQGKNGFGYDPILFVTAFGKTMAELPPELKNQVSHRAKAARKVPALLRKKPFSVKKRG